MKKLIFAVILIYALFYSGCKTAEEILIVTTGNAGSVGSDGHPDSEILTIELTKGAYWYEHFPLGPFKIKITPQIAVWAEDPDGNFLSTIYITHKFAKQNWGTRVEYDPDTVFRVEALPVFYYRSGLSISQNNPVPDALTSATPMNNLQVNTTINSPSNRIIIYLEINNSYDYAETEEPFNEPLNERHNGQPSVVYRAVVDRSEAAVTRMEYFGHSDQSGRTGEIFDGRAAVPTAVDIIEKCTVYVHQAGS